MDDTIKTPSVKAADQTVTIRRTRLGQKGRKADPNSLTTKIINSRTEDKLTPKAKAFRDRFLAEYIRDWCGPDAYIRAGGAASSSLRQSSMFLREPYVVRKLQELLDAMEEEKLLDNKTILMGLIKEARFQGIGASHGARVSAWKTLANIKGMEQVQVRGKVEHDHVVRGGVMLVPVTPGTEEWEKLASSTQKQLKEDVRT